jgi:hypothetical protein
MSSVSWFPSKIDLSIASFRLRCYRPNSVLKARGFQTELRSSSVASINVFDKNFDLLQIKSAYNARRKIVLDLCDNFLLDGHHRKSVIEDAAQICDVITVPTLKMKSVVSAAFPTVRCEVIPDMLEFEQPVPPRLNGKTSSIIWFGNFGSKHLTSGLFELNTVIKELDAESVRAIELFSEQTIFTNFQFSPILFELYRRGWAYSKWTPNWSSTYSSRNLCYLPSIANGYTMTKSPNRALTAVMSGFPIYASGNESFDDLALIRPSPDLVSTANYVLNRSSKQLVSHVIDSQIFVKEQYSELLISDLWLKLFHSL